MDYGKHKTTSAEFQDEDKYARLTKRQWIIVIPCAILAIIILRITYGLGILPIGISVTVVIAAAAVITAFFPMPMERYLFGGGVRFEILLFRILRKKLPWNKRLYSRNMEE